MPRCKVCNTGSGEVIGTCHPCERELAILRDAWARIREVSTVVPSPRDERILDGLADLVFAREAKRNAPPTNG
jgi:hypothetical protein